MRGKGPSQPFLRAVAMIVWMKNRREFPSRISASVAARRRSTRSGSVTPKTTAMITSSEIACMWVSARVGRP